MTLNASYIARLDDDPDRLAAMMHLADEATRYPPGLFTPALERPKNDDKPKRFVAIAIDRGWDDAQQTASLGAIAIHHSEGFDWHISENAEGCAGWLAESVLSRDLSGTISVLDGGTTGVLDILLAWCGRELLGLGYSLEPCLGQHGISWMKVRKGKRSWTLTTVETMTGCDLGTLLDFAHAANISSGLCTERAAAMYSALLAYTSFLSESFGTALRPTIGMIASACARRFLPESVVKWRPSPLLIAMEIVGKGYRGGVTYGRKFRGELHRIDVNRQYTALLRTELPMEAVFTRWKGAKDDRSGVFVCTIETECPVAYPVGQWSAYDRKFTYGRVDSGRAVCVLHTSEFRGLYAHGVSISPGLGFAFTSTFSLGAYVDRIEDITRRHGRDSATGRLTKPLGNMVYGKFGQKPDRWQLLYAIEAPDKSWFPYFNDAGEDIRGVWEREQVRYSSGMHVDIASTITGAARSQTMQTWAYLEALGYTVVRAHTDSITTYGDPREVMATDHETFGEWKYEGVWKDGVVVGPNGFADSRGSHLAGIRSPNRAMLDALYRGETVSVSEQQNAPRQGWQRGTREVTKRLTG